VLYPILLCPTLESTELDGNYFRVEESASAVSTMPQSGLTSRDRRVRRSRTVGAKTIVSLISFLACLYGLSLPPRSESRGEIRRRIELLREIRGREGEEGKKGMDHEELASRSPRNVRLTQIGDSKNAAGRFPGHAFVETLFEHQVSLPLLPRLALDMLRGCAYSEQVSSLRKRVPVRPLGHEENYMELYGTAKCSQSRPVTKLPAMKRYLRIEEQFNFSL